MENEKIIELVRKSAFWIDPKNPQIIYLNTNTLKDDLKQIRKDAVKREQLIDFFNFYAKNRDNYGGVKREQVVDDYLKSIIAEAD